MNVSMIAAVASNRVIGKDGGIPWDIPSDLKWFRDTTRGCPVIMGRKTHESIGRLLPGRLNVIVTSDSELLDMFTFTGNPRYVNSLEDAIGICTKEKEIFLIGGQRIYEEGMKHANKLYISHVAAVVEGDTFFPEIDPKVWSPAAKMSQVHLEEDEYPFSVIVYNKK